MGCCVGDLGSLGYCGGRKLCGIQIQNKGKLAGAKYYLHPYSFICKPSVYVDCLALSISSDFWLRWLVHEA